MSERLRPLRDGNAAFDSGVPYDANPYKPGETRTDYKGIDLHTSWSHGWKAGEMDAILAKSPIPDLSLIAQAENLIPKGFYWCGHELNRTLGYYRDACDKGDAYQIKLNERSLRRAMVNARLEAAGLPIPR